MSAWFDAASAEKPGAANRAYEILRAMLNSARQWVKLGESVPDACANIVKNPRRPVARYLNREELNRLGTVLDRHEQDHPWPVVAIRLLTLTGACLSEVLNLRWDEIGDVSEEDSSARSSFSRLRQSSCSRHGSAEGGLGQAAEGRNLWIARPKFVECAGGARRIVVVSRVV